ncbi:SRPBCC family protein [Nocardioides dubius]|uniref:SRPBCC family protein n=1 Tax=Nocardioides dubius TaxID=317019 RepID=A0ABN1U1M7_9ACTN
MSTTAGGDADRELRAEVVIAAGPSEVWTVLSDVSVLSAGSPETVRMLPLKSGGMRVGQWYLGINRRGWVWWPTRNVVATVDPQRALVWDTASSGARWIYELSADPAGTRVVHRRPVPRRLTLISKVFAATLLGGAVSHADELEAGMARTLAGVKARVEAAAG